VVGTRRDRKNKQPAAVGSFRKQWIAACQAAGCPGRIPLDFRRMVVRNLVRAGIPRARRDDDDGAQDALGVRAVQHREP